MSATKSSQLTLNFRAGQPIPGWVREIIDAHLAIEAEDAQSAGSLGFMARALVIATMPYKDPKSDVFKRQNGDFRLRIVAGYEGGIPYGIYPRLLTSWVSTEAVRTRSPVIQLGDCLHTFVRDVMDLRSNGGGPRGSGSRVAEQMKRLFGSLITAHYTGTQQQRGFVLRNVLIADELQLDDAELTGLWTPQHAEEAGRWKSQVRLSNGFFRECLDNPVPIDLRAYKALRGSPLAMDVYTWLTYRMSYTHRRTRPIRWEALMMQFGSDYGTETAQAVRDFRKAFLKALKLVLVVYSQARIEVDDAGVVLLPSRPQSLLPPTQHDLF
ncbi:replication protein RepA [Aromatoleum anaerobium]|uniref:Pirin n=1 Tax=Aromatoleum anaerobium TaxID=182180 RepID=A0ABX1PNG8_9RHOO|nr:replication protein RepA [Aromatoleum anaerobium]MCK0508577.1 replication protein RepA [Aromatoleum anaerobium]